MAIKKRIENLEEIQIGKSKKFFVIRDEDGPWKATIQCGGKIYTEVQLAGLEKQGVNVQRIKIHWDGQSTAVGGQQEPDQDHGKSGDRYPGRNRVYVGRAAAGERRGNHHAIRKVHVRWIDDIQKTN